MLTKNVHTNKIHWDKSKYTNDVAVNASPLYALNISSHDAYWNIQPTIPFVAINALRSRQNGRNFPDDIFTWILLNKTVCNLIQISLKCVPVAPINNIPALFRIMVWRRPGDKPLSEPMMVSLLTHRPQWVKNHIISLIVNSLFLYFHEQNTILLLNLPTSHRI